MNLFELTTVGEVENNRGRIRNVVVVAKISERLRIMTINLRFKIGKVFGNLL